jgi:hypothetical protein
MTVMNIQSNASGSNLESVAFMVAYAKLLTPERQIKFLDQIIDLIQSPSLSSLRRMVELCNILMQYQELVTFIHSTEAGPLEPFAMSPLQATYQSSSNQPQAMSDKLRNSEFARNLEYYLLEVNKLTLNS